MTQPLTSQNHKAAQCDARRGIHDWGKLFRPLRWLFQCSLRDGQSSDSGDSRVVLDVLEQRERLPVEQQQELGQVGAPQGQAGLQHEHLNATQEVN